MPFTERAAYTSDSTTFVAALPPTLRVVIYGFLALTNAVLVPLVAAGNVDPVWSSIVVSVSGVFGFTLAASNVTKTVPSEAPVVETDPDEAAEV